MQCSTFTSRRMKLLAFWLLVLFAVLIPATAVIASATTAPTAAELRREATQSASVSKHAAASGVHAKMAKAKPKANPKVQTAKTASADQLGDHCCDLTPCSQCSGCGTCPAMAMNADVGTDALPLPLTLLPESLGPRAEFLLSGQERPPRAS